MSEKTHITKDFVLENKYGLHARPSSMIVKTAMTFESEVTIKKDDLSGNGKSIMELMMLAAAPGESVTITVNGTDADCAMLAIEQLFVNKFGEDN